MLSERADPDPACVRVPTVVHRGTTCCRPPCLGRIRTGGRGELESSGPPCCWPAGSHNREGQTNRGSRSLPGVVCLCARARVGGGAEMASAAAASAAREAGEADRSGQPNRALKLYGDAVALLLRDLKRTPPPTEAERLAISAQAGRCLQRAEELKALQETRVRGAALVAAREAETSGAAAELAARRRTATLPAAPQPVAAAERDRVSVPAAVPPAAGAPSGVGAVLTTGAAGAAAGAAVGLLVAGGPVLGLAAGLGGGLHAATRAGPVGESARVAGARAADGLDAALEFDRAHDVSGKLAAAAQQGGALLSRGMATAVEVNVEHRVLERGGDAAARAAAGAKAAWGSAADFNERHQIAGTVADAGQRGMASAAGAWESVNSWWSSGSKSAAAAERTNI